MTNAMLEDVSIISDKILLPLTNIVKSGIIFIIGSIYITRINYILALIIIPLGIITAVLNAVSEKKYIENAVDKKAIYVSLWKSFSEIFKGIIPISIYKREKDYGKIVEENRTYKQHIISNFAMQN